METVNEKLNPNWKIDKFRAYLDKCGRFNYKVMWEQPKCLWSTQFSAGITRGVLARVFKSRDSALEFIGKKRLIGGVTNISFSKWDADTSRWIEDGG